MEAKMNISKCLKDLRKEHGLTQQQLADNTGITLKSIQNYENAVREPNSKSMAILEKFFNVSGAFLRGESLERNPVTKWEDSEYMNTLEEEYYTLTRSLADAALQQNEKNIKDISDIIIELRTLIKYTDETNLDKALELIKQNIISVKRVYDKES